MIALTLIASAVGLGGCALGAGNAMRTWPSDRLANLALALVGVGAIGLAAIAVVLAVTGSAC